MLEKSLKKAQDAASLYMGSYPDGIIHGTARHGKVITVYGTTKEVLAMVPDTIDGFEVDKIVMPSSYAQINP
ncbi:hypothetical protein LCGC14_1099840 [marine sediment metagenome]|uniref:Uncharacterized protein n=1 Tax=marine sediment metagenome TaxID=412755 RepID=A0A0F9QFX5_9ZZZZ